MPASDDPFLTELVGDWHGSMTNDEMSIESQLTFELVLAGQFLQMHSQLQGDNWEPERT